MTTPRRLIEGETMSMLATVDQLVLKPLKWLGLELPFDLFELIDRHLPNNRYGAQIEILTGLVRILLT